MRVDILYTQLSERGKEWLDLLGTARLPDAVDAAHRLAVVAVLHASRGTIQEISSNAGGLIRWPVKILVPLGFALLALQGVSEIIKRAAALRGYVRFETHYERPVQ